MPTDDAGVWRSAGRRRRALFPSRALWVSFGAMFRSTLLLAFFCAVLGASACRHSKPSQPKPNKPNSQQNSPKPTPWVAFQPPAEATPQLHRRWEITVKAGSRARDDAVVSALLPGIPLVNSALVWAPSGASVPSQMQGNGQVAFKAKALKAGTQAIYLAEEKESAPASGKGGVLAVQAPDGVKLTIDGKPVLTYQIQRQPVRKDIAPEYWRNGYLHPLYSPAGVMVTDDYPKDKPCQHGIWSGWQKVESEGSHPNFWDAGLKKGRVGMESVSPLWGGPFRGGLDSHQFFTDLDLRPGSTILREGWSVTAFRDASRAPYFVVDLQSSQEAMKGQPILGQNPFGGITMRGNPDWQGASHSLFLTSEGQDRAKAQGEAARWCYLGGKSGGKLAGVAILSRPQNRKQPEAVFIDPEDPVMGFAPTKNGPITLRSGEPLKLHYRFVVLDGKPDRKLFDRLWNDFANPPEVEARLLENK